MKGRPALSVAAWKARVAERRVRCGGRCEVPWCRVVAAHLGRRLDPHHVIPTALGGPDAAWNILMVGGGPDGCHDRFDVPYKIGKLSASSVAPSAERWEISLQYRVGKRGPLLAGAIREFYERPSATGTVVAESV